MNLTILKGNLGKDPEVKIFEWGKVASFTLATTEKYKNKKGELISETDWHTCVFHGNVCEAIEKYLHKGDQVIVTGKTRYRSYLKEGATIYITEIKCSEFEFCGGKRAESPRDVESDIRDGKFNDPEELSDSPF